MNLTTALMMALVAWVLLRVRYQREHIALLGRHLASFQLERHMETLTQGYLRAIYEDTQSRQLQVLETFAPTERAVAGQLESLSQALQQESHLRTRMGTLPFCVPYLERLLPALTRDFRALLHIHAAGVRHVVDNVGNWSPKDRAFHLSAELFLFQHSCHWYCKSRSVADARLTLRHQVKHQKVLESVSPPTRAAYLQWLNQTG